MYKLSVKAVDFERALVFNLTLSPQLLSFVSETHPSDYTGIYLGYISDLIYIYLLFIANVWNDARFTSIFQKILCTIIESRASLSL